MMPDKPLTDRQFEVHVLSNTHWDREWRFPFQQTRLILVDLVDKLLEILDQEAGYKHYHFDSQTIALEDYLELRPEKREKLAAHIKSGRIWVGPWYTLPEEFSVGGEALVRNLLRGRRIGDSFGRTMKVGYTPTSYGQISQMAQIYAGFGIDGMVFYRGIHKDECGNEYLLEAPDGTRILGIRLSQLFSRGAFYVHILKRTMHPPDWMGYTWEQGWLPFHLATADEDHEEEPVLLKANFGDNLHLESIPRSVTGAINDIGADASTKYLVLLDGMDSTFPNKNTPRVIEECNRVNKNWKFLHSSFPAFLRKLSAAVDRSKLPVLRGERRRPSRDNMFNAFLKDTISCRIYLKQRNAEVERSLEQWAEPLSVLAWLEGREYPAAALDLAWKHLLASHPHDSIGGFSPDQIHADMMYRFDQADIIAKALAKRGLGHLVSLVDSSGAKPEDVLLTVFNPLAQARSDVAVAFVDFPREKGIRAFSVYDDRGKKVAQQALFREDSYLIATEPAETPMTFFTTKWKIAFEAAELPPLGFKTYTVRPEPGKKANYGTQIVAPNTMENEHLRVRIESNGTLTITHKGTGRVYRNCNFFEDGGESGDPWMHWTPQSDRVVNSLGGQATIALEHDGPLLTTYRVELRLRLPISLTEDKLRRSEVETEYSITCHVTLKKGCPRVEIETVCNNTIKDHRLRVLFESGIAAERASVSGQFDVIDREIHVPDHSDWAEPWTGTHPQYGCVEVSDGEHGFALLNFGLTEYEVLEDEPRTIALTLLRTFRYPKMSGLGREDRVARVGQEGSQCPGEQTCHYALYPHAGRWEEAEAMRQMYEHKYPLRIAHHGRHPGEKFGLRQSFLRLEPGELCLSALKKAEDRRAVVVRFYNPTGREIKGKLWFHRPIKRARLLNLNEEPQAELKVRRKQEIELTVGHKKIVTLELSV
jgi:alpha-mannosidase